MELDIILDKCISTGDLSREEVAFLLSLENEEDIARLIAAADEVRKRYCGDDVHIRGLIEFSNTCKNDCLYCGLRRSNLTVHRYRMTADEIVTTALHLADRNLGTVVLQSGEDLFYNAEMMAEIIRRIKS